MPGVTSALPLLFAQGQGAGAAGQDGGSGITSLLIMILPIMVLYYFMIARPQQQQERERRKMVDNLKKNDKVITSAGIYGTVVSVDPAADKVVLRVDDQVKLTFSKASVLRVVDQAPEKDKDKDKDKEKPAETAQKS